MDTEKLIIMVNDILGNDDLCDGCSKNSVYNMSCAQCRRLAADKIIKILKERKNKK